MKHRKLKSLFAEKDYGVMGTHTGTCYKVGDLVTINNHVGIVVYNKEHDEYSVYGQGLESLPKLISKLDINLLKCNDKVTQEDINKHKLCIKIVEESSDIKSNALYNIIFKKVNSVQSLFIGRIENFNINGSCTFSNDDGELLLIQYEQLIEISKY